MQSMKLIHTKHDLINIQILDKAEHNILKLGMIKLHDAENQTSMWIDTNNREVQGFISNQIRRNINVFKTFTINVI